MVLIPISSNGNHLIYMSKEQNNLKRNIALEPKPSLGRKILKSDVKHNQIGEYIFLFMIVVLQHLKLQYIIVSNSPQNNNFIAYPCCLSFNLLPYFWSETSLPPASRFASRVADVVPRFA